MCVTGRWRNAGVAAYRLGSAAKSRGEAEAEDKYFDNLIIQAGNLLYGSQGCRSKVGFWRVFYDKIGRSWSKLVEIGRNWQILVEIGRN